MEFRTPSYFALATLIDGPLHGYAIVQRAAELSDGAVRLSTGTLYALLEGAIDDGLAAAGAPPLPGARLAPLRGRGRGAGLAAAGAPYREGGRTRRDYTLTPEGRSALD